MSTFSLFIRLFSYLYIFSIILGFCSLYRLLQHSSSFHFLFFFLSFLWFLYSLLPLLSLICYFFSFGSVIFLLFSFHSLIFSLSIHFSFLFCLFFTPSSPFPLAIPYLTFPSLHSSLPSYSILFSFFPIPIPLYLLHTASLSLASSFHSRPPSITAFFSFLAFFTFLREVGRPGLPVGHTFFASVFCNA